MEFKMRKLFPALIIIDAILALTLGWPFEYFFALLALGSLILTLLHVTCLID